MRRHFTIYTLICLLMALGLFHAAPAAQASDIWTENWDAGTGSLPAGWNTLGGSSVHSVVAGASESPAITPTSGANMHKLFSSTAGLQTYIYKNTTDGNGGDSEIEFYSEATEDGNAYHYGILRSDGVPTLSTTEFYLGGPRFDTGLRIEYQTSNTMTALTTVGSASTFTNGIRYRTIFRAVGTTLSIKCQRQDNSQWLNSSGTWQASEVWAATITDTTSGMVRAGHSGIKFLSGSSTTKHYTDSLTFRTASSSTPATGITFTGPSSGYLNQASTNFTVALDPPGGTVSGTVTVTPATSLSGTFSPTTVNLTTGSASATFTFTPTVTGSHSLSITNNGGLTNGAPLTYTVTKPPITVGVISISSSPKPSDTSVQLTTTVPTGGTNSGFSYQWKLCSTADGTYSNVGTNSTTLTLTTTQLTTSAVWFVKCVYTDDDTPTPNTATTVAFPVSLWDPPIVIGVIGDSTFANESIGGTGAGITNNGIGSVGGALGTYIAQSAPQKSVPSTANTSVGGSTGLSQAQGGSYTSTWAPTGSNAVNTAYTNVWQSASVTHVIIMLGMNDAISGNGGTAGSSAATYQSNLLSICQYLTARSIKVGIVAPYAINPLLYAGQGSPAWPLSQALASCDLIRQYQGAIINVAATDPANIKYLGDDVYREFGNNSTYYNSSDGIHVSSTGGTAMARTVAKMFLRTFYPTGGSVVRKVQGQ